MSSHSPEVVPRILLSVAHGQAQTTIAVDGEIESTTAAALCIEAFAAVDQGARVLVLNLAAVEFVDVHGIRTLLRIRDHAANSGCGLALARVPHALRHLLVVTGLAEQFDYDDDQ